MGPRRNFGVRPNYAIVLQAKVQVDDKRQKSVDSDLETKVNDLLELMSKWDVACAAMPSNLKKLQGLHRLHEQGASTSMPLHRYHSKYY